MDLTVGGRVVVRVTSRRARNVFGRVTVLRAGKGGRPVLHSEVRAKRRLWLTTICGAFFCTPWGSVMVQFKGWPA